MALLLSALCGISLPSQSFESLSRFGSGALDAAARESPLGPASTAGAPNEQPAAWDGRVRSRESFDPSGGPVTAVEVARACALTPPHCCCHEPSRGPTIVPVADGLWRRHRRCGLRSLCRVRPPSTHSIDIQRQNTVSHVDSAASLVNSLADICESYDIGIATPSSLTTSFLGRPARAVDSNAPTTAHFSLRSTALQEQGAAAAVAGSNSGEDPGVSPSLQPTSEIAGTSTLFDAVGRPVLMPQVAQDPIMPRRRGPARNATCSHSAAEMSRASFEPMYERDDDADALAWRRGGGGGSQPGAVGRGGAGRMRSSRTETNLRSLSATQPAMRASCDLPVTAYPSARCAPRFT